MFEKDEWSNWIEKFLDQWSPNWGRSTIRIPLGDRNFPPMETASEGLPGLVPEPTPKYALPLPPPIDRRDTAPDATLLPEDVEDLGVALSDAEWLIRMGLPPLASQEPLRVFDPPFVPALPGTLARAEQAPLLGEMRTMDIEDEEVGWINDIYTIVDAVGYEGNLPGGAPPQLVEPGTGGSVINPSSLPTVIPSGPTPTATTGDKKTYCYKYIDGQWKLVKMRRKRRRKLVTKSDIAGLAQLKGVIGMGKAFETWIATHS